MKLALTKNVVRMVSLAGMLGAVTLLHTLVGMGRHSAGHHDGGGLLTNILHITLAHLYIIPIILGAYWFGIRGGVLVSIISSALFTPHIFVWMDPVWSIYNYVEIFLFLLIGGMTGVLIEMERNQRQRYENALVRLDESHRNLKAQTEVLFQTEEQLRRADRLSALGELSAGMAHEIRNPLGSIKGAAEILKDNYGPDAPQHEFIEILLKETDRLNKIVQEFLRFARPKPPELREEDINELLESVLSLTAQPTRKAGISVEKRLDRSIGKRDLDAGLLQQAFLNLVLNSVQAMPQGGTLTVVSAWRDDGIEVKIVDTGMGISADNRKKLFSPFFTTKKDGTGLGLAITYRIIQNHRGTIDVASEPGKGATFTITLPA
jgi:two-component system sensor histidine kinase HydH